MGRLLPTLPPILSGDEGGWLQLSMLTGGGKTRRAARGDVMSIGGVVVRNDGK